MAFDEKLDQRVRKMLENKNISYEAKLMMGGVCYIMNDKMLAGISKDKLMARIDPEIHEQLVAGEGVTEMDMTGRHMKGLVFVLPKATSDDKLLEKWMDLCIDYNPKAPLSKKKQKKNK